MDNTIAVMAIVLGGLYIYPVLSVVLLWFTRHKPKARRTLLITSTTLASVALFGALTAISTTSIALDWFMLTSIYFLVSTCVWLAIINPNKIAKVLGGLMLFIVFGAGYLAGTVGIFGFFYLSYKVPSKVRYLANGYIYKEMDLTVPLGPYEGKLIEIYRTIPWLPIVEWQVCAKRNNEIRPM